MTTLTASFDDAALPPVASQIARVVPDLQQRGAAFAHLIERLAATVWRDKPVTPHAACLCAIAAELDGSVDVTRLVEALPRTDSIFDTLTVENTLANLGFNSRHIRVEARAIDPRLLPCLFLMPGANGAMTPMVIGRNANADTFFLFDGVSQQFEPVASLADLPAGQGMAIIFQPFVDERDPTSAEFRSHTGHSWFQALLSRFHVSFLQVVLLSIMLNAVTLGTPIFVILVYDQVIATRTIEPLTMLAVGALVSITAEAVLRSARARALAWLAARTDYIVGTSIFARMIQLPSDVIERASVAAQVARIKSFEAVRDFIGGPIFVSVLDAPTILLSALIIGLIGGKLAWLTLGCAMTYAALFVLLRNRIRVVMSRAAHDGSIAQKLVLETFEKLDAIRSCGLSESWLSKFQEVSGRENDSQFKLYFWSGAAEVASHVLTIGTGVTILVVGTESVWGGELTTGAMVGCMILSWRVLAPFQSICTMVPRYEQIRKSIAQINELMDLRTERDRDLAATRLPGLRGGVGFTGVGFRYERSTNLLFFGLELEIRPGEIIAITGSNGSGKSTLLKLVQGLYEPQLGSVRIDGVDVRQLATADLRRQIAYVPQVPHLFGETIAEDLRYVDPIATDEELWTVLRIVGAASAVEAMRNGIYTDVADDKVLQANTELLHQIAMARAILQNSRLIIIDELPNATLNAGLADAMKRMIREIKGQRTLIFVTHRRDLMRQADRVIALRHGAVPTVGPLDRIMEEVR